VRGKKGEFLRELEQWRKAGFTKAYIDGTLRDLGDPILLSKYQNHEIDVLLDSVQPSKADLENRVKEAFALADKIAGGWLKVSVIAKKQEKLFNKKIAAAGTDFSFPELEPRLFSFNSPYGMCEKCRGSGVICTNKSKNTSDDEEDDEFWSLPDVDESETCTACQGRRVQLKSLSSAMLRPL
jgi:excinuclease ABC subunit A